MALFNYHLGDFLGWKNEGIRPWKSMAAMAQGGLLGWDRWPGRKFFEEISDTSRVSTWFSDVFSIGKQKITRFCTILWLLSAVDAI